jgi:hypothetical protein
MTALSGLSGAARAAVAAAANRPPAWAASRSMVERKSDRPLRTVSTNAFGRRTGLGEGTGHQLGPGRLGGGPPGVLGCVSRFGGRVEDDLADVHRSDSVDHRVVGLRDDCESVSRHALDQVHLPERSVAVERTALDARHELVQLGIGARARERRPAHVVGEVEVFVVDPDRVGQPARHPAYALAITRYEGDAVTDQVDQALVVESRLGCLEDGYPADVHRCRRLLEVEEGHI